ncbi:MAG TPA: PP2C family protein-serine/threonine phosphatase, partial [Candidatus Krumholzibacteria bacterium]|nr:PP2C family protein-serine/threonine phosphatase [Candidatus Krumholzibacteria bacterium]
LRRSELEGQLQEAHSIQTSLFPGRSFTFDGYEIAGQSLPADQVGGDMLDYLPISANLLGLAVGDASGHGLPAALQARDVITGLRMGVEKDLKITAVCERLNRVIHRSGLTSRFVSLFFGELELNGNFVYVNAGHDPALLLRKGKRGQLLKSTGLVLGPVKDLEYRRGLVNIEPGDMLALYTDGIVERQGPDGEYGLARLRSLLQSRLDEDRPVLEILDEVFEDVRSFGQGQAWADDVTLMLVRRKPLADK